MSRSESRRRGATDRELGLTLERFDYASVGEHVAVVQVLAAVSDERGLPAEAELRVRRGHGRDAVHLTFPAQSCRTERRLLAGGGSELLWKALFTLPLAFTQRPGILFELSLPDGHAFILPAPEMRVMDAHGLDLLPASGLDAASRLGPAQVRQAIALATAVAVTATSTPSLALAESGISAPSHAQTTQQRIESLARGAQAQLQQSATVKSTQGTAALGQPKSSATAHTPPAPAAGPSTPHPSSPPPPTPAPPAAHPAHGTTPSTPPHPGRATPAHRPGSPAHPAGSASHRRTGPAKPPPCTRPEAVAAVSNSTGTATCTLRPRTGYPSAVDGLGARHSTVNAHRPGRPGRPGTHRHPVTASHSTKSTSLGPSTPTPLGDSGGVAAGTGTSGLTATPPTTVAPAPTTTAPTPTTSTPQLTPNPPAVSRVRPEPASHSQRPRPARDGGSALHPVGGLSSKPPVKLPGSSTPTAGAPMFGPTPAGFLGPKSWTGTVTNDPALVGALGDLSNLLTNGDSPPRFLIPIYMEAGRRYHVPWEVLAAINAVESDYGRNLNTSTAGAIGWMQFEPSTWQKYGLAVDGHSVPNPYDPRDAIFSAARYLSSAGAATDLWGAIYAYNHAGWYVNMVLTRARAIAANVRPQHQTISRHGVVSLFFSTFTHPSPLTHHRRVVRYKGGILSRYDRLVAAANMVSAANFPYVWGGGHEQPARFGPFDCSGSVSYAMQQAGYKLPTTVSGDISSWKFPTGPGRVTIFFNATHTFMRIGSRYFGTSGIARPGGGAGWFSTNQLPVGYLAQFNEVHVPHLGPNSFAPAHRAGPSPA